MFIVIDSYHHTRCAAFALQSSESLESHGWVMDCLIALLPSTRFVLITDFDMAIHHLVEQRLPDITHILCVHHVQGNAADEARKILGGEYKAFFADFWTVYHAISEAAFQRAWDRLISDWPAMDSYLTGTLWPVRHKWAWYSVSRINTLGMRTSGRVEREQRINKLLGDSKTPLNALVPALNDHVLDQQAKFERSRRHVRQPCVALI